LAQPSNIILTWKCPTLSNTLAYFIGLTFRFHEKHIKCSNFFCKAEPMVGSHLLA
jgi:hypothetical protein